MNTLSNTWLTESVKESFREYFDEISERIAEIISKSKNISDNISDEEFITGKLIEIINHYYDSPVYNNLKNKIKEETGIHFEIYGWKNNKASEWETGADLGILLNVKSSNFEEKKSIIIQSKKAVLNRGRIYYPELRKRGISQANKMLQITPASFFFLYNPSEIVNIDHYKPIIHSRLLDKVWYLYRISGVNPKKKRKAYLGIIVLPANIIGSSKGIVSSFETIFPLGISFSEFMIDFFFPCFVGDKREEILLKSGANRDFVENIITKYSLEFKLYEG